MAILREEGFGEDGGKAAGGKGGVVHSFTGTIDEAVELVSRNIMNNMIVILNPASDGYGISHQVCISGDLWLLFLVVTNATASTDAGSKRKIT